MSSRFPAAGNPAFTLIEMLAVIAVTVILLTAGAHLGVGSNQQARKAGIDLLAGLIEQARGAAITSRCHVVLAIAEPADLPGSDEHCRVGLFKVASWPERTTETIDSLAMTRWRLLESGVVMIGGEVEGVANPLDGPELTLAYGVNHSLRVTVHAIVFNPRGGLCYPESSTPVVLRLAEGNYRQGKAVPYQRAGSGTITEHRLKIGRVTARPYRIDG